MDYDSNDYPATTATPGVVPVGYTDSGVISFDGDVDWFRTDLYAGLVYRVTMEAGSMNGLFDSQLSIYDANGGLLTQVTTGQGFQTKTTTYTPASAGPVYLAASGSSGLTGTYRMTVALESGTLNATVSGTSLNDSLPAGVNDVINGGAGTDTVTLGGARANYNVIKTTQGTAVSAINGGWGTNMLVDVERVAFSDKKLALDMGVTQSGGQAALLIGAVLGQSLAFSNDPIKQQVLGNAIALFDDPQYNMQVLAGALMRLNHDSLDIWTALAGGNDLTSIARYVLTTVNSLSPPDNATLTAAVNQLQSETGNVAVEGTWLANQALSSTNQLQVALVGLANWGMTYL